MAPTTVPLLVISGSMGTGKTTVLSEASDLLGEAGIAHAAIDLDWLAVMHPQREPYGQRLALANLAAVWPTYAAAGAERLIVARVVEDRRGARPLPGGRTVCPAHRVPSDRSHRTDARTPAHP